MIVDIKGVGQAQFPDEMPIDDIRSFLRNKYYQRAAQGQSDILSPAPQTVSPYEPTLTERLGGGIAEGLKGAGLISDNYGAQQIGKNVTALGEFLPGIGDAAAGDEFGRAVAEGDNLGMGRAALGAIPVVGDAAKEFVRVAHGTMDKGFDGIVKRAAYYQPFDGIFASYGDFSEYGGNKTINYDIAKDKIASMGDADFDYDKSIEFLKKEYPDADDDVIDDMYELSVEDANIFERDSNPFANYGYEDGGEASWQAQNLRGLIAADQGFDAVEMSDEFGTSLLIPYGSKAKPINQSLPMDKK